MPNIYPVLIKNTESKPVESLYVFVESEREAFINADMVSAALFRQYPNFYADGFRPQFNSGVIVFAVHPPIKQFKSGDVVANNERGVLRLGVVNKRVSETEYEVFYDTTLKASISNYTTLSKFDNRYCFSVIRKSNNPFSKDVSEAARISSKIVRSICWTTKLDDEISHQIFNGLVEELNGPWH